jgi:hypothetical protein
MYLVLSSLLCSHCLFASIWHFWWGNGVKGAKSYFVLVLNAKGGGELRAKANGSANHLCISKMFDQNPFIWKLFSYGGEVDYGKGGVLHTWSNLLLINLLICPNKCVWLRDRKKNLNCENKPSGGKSDPNIPNLKWEKIGSSNLHFWEWCCTFSCFLMCWHKSPKRGRLKGKCALGSFL